MSWLLQHLHVVSSEVASAFPVKVRLQITVRDCQEIAVYSIATDTRHPVPCFHIQPVHTKLLQHITPPPKRRFKGTIEFINTHTLNYSIR